MRQMTARYLRCLGLVMSLALAAIVVTPVHFLGDPANSGTFAIHARQQRLVESYGRLLLSFELNQGQTDRRVRFLSRGSGYALFLTANEAVLSLHQGNPMSKPGAAQTDRRLALNRHLQPAVFKPASAAQHHAPSTDAAVVWMKLVGANPRARVSGVEQLPGRSNYFIGNDPNKWRINIPTYGKVKYANIYPGVDLVYYGNQRQLEYDFVVQPGADPSQIALAVQASGAKLSGHNALWLDGNGDLVISTGGGEVRFHKPVVYQSEAGANRLVKDREQSTRKGHLVEGTYRLKGNRVSFELASYDKRQPLVIDPTLAYSTYLGGSDTDGGGSIAVDASGNAYVTGFTGSTDFPITPGAFQATNHAGYLDNAFVSKLNPNGSALLYSTYLGGSGDINDDRGDYGIDIAVDASGNAYVTGSTSSTDFPTTPGAFRTTLGGVLALNAFVSKLNPNGSALLYSTYLGGNVDFEFDRADGIAVDRLGNAFVTGLTDSTDFPTTPGAFQTTYGGSYDVFVSKLKSDGSALVYSTYLGGSDSDVSIGIAVDSSGNAYVTGITTSTNFPTTPGAFQTTLRSTRGNAFVSKLNATGSALVYSTYLGGSGFDGDGGYRIALDGSSNTYVTGYTFSTNFPTTPGAFQTILHGLQNAFVSKLNVAGSALVYSTYLGGSGFNGDDGYGIALDASGNAYVTGTTTSTDFPTTPGAFQTTLHGSCCNAFVSKLNATGSALVYSTYLGGSVADDGYGIALDASGNAYVTGQAGSTDFPTTPGAFQTTYGGFGDAFVSRFSFGIPFAQFGGHLRIDPDAGVFSLSSSFTLGSGGSINPLTQQVSFSVGNYAVIVPAGAFFKVSNGYVYQKKANNIFLCLYIIKNKNTPGRYSLLANSGRGALTGTTMSPVPVRLTIGDDSGSTQMNVKFD